MQVSQSSNQLSGEPEKDYSNNIVLFNISSPCQNASSGTASNFRKRLRLLSDLYMFSICKDFIYATLLYHEPHLAIKEAIFNINILHCKQFGPVNSFMYQLVTSCISRLAEKLVCLLAELYQQSHSSRISVGGQLQVHPKHHGTVPWI